MNQIQGRVCVLLPSVAVKAHKENAFGYMNHANACQVFRWIRQASGSAAEQHRSFKACCIPLYSLIDGADHELIK